jgi:hypothetical protein
VAMVETLVVLDPLVDLARLEGAVSAMAAPTGAPFGPVIGEVSDASRLKTSREGYSGFSTLVGHPETANVATTTGNRFGPEPDAAPTEAGAVPCTSLPSDHACMFSTCWPR